MVFGMAYFLLIIFHCVFVRFFVSIGVRYLSIIPILFIGFFIFNNTISIRKYDDIHTFVEYDMYYISRSIVMMALYMLLVTIGISPIYVWFFLIVFNMVLYIFSLLYQYKEWIIIFHVWWYMSWLLYIWHMSILFGPLAGWKLFCLLCVFNFGVYSFIQFTIWSIVRVPVLHGYLTFLYAQSAILILLGSIKSENILINLLAWQLYLMWNYGVIYAILRYYHYYANHHKADLKYILSGQKLFDIPAVLRNQTINMVYTFFDDLTPIIKYTFWWLNIVVVVVVIVVFTRYYRNSDIFSITMYWLSLILFFVNYTILKKINYQARIERAGIFVIITVWVLLGVGAVFDDVVMQVMISIVWNLGSSMSIFYARQQLSNILSSHDYWYRFWSNTVWIFFIVWNIISLPINPNIRFSLCLFYICLYVFIALQIYKFLKQYPLVGASQNAID